jgi:hypothetical protein
VACEGFKMVGDIILSWNRVGPWLYQVDQPRRRVA